MGLWSLLMAFLSQLPSNVKLDDLSDWSQRLRPQRTGMWWKKEDSSCFSYVIEDGVPFKWNAVVAARKLSVDCWDKCCEGYCVLSLDPSSIIHHPSSIVYRPATGRGRIQDTGYASISRGQTDRHTFYEKVTGFKWYPVPVQLRRNLIGRDDPHTPHTIEDTSKINFSQQELFASQGTKRTRNVRKELTVTAVICGVLLLCIVLIMWSVEDFWEMLND